MNGGLFFQVNDSVTPTAVVAKLRGEGKISKTDPKTLEGFGEDGVVGIAVHAARDGWLAVIDSADGAQGINADKKGWAACGTMSNHLHADAVWYRVYSAKLAIGVRFFRSNDDIHVIAGDQARVEAWLDEQGVPWKTSAPPASAKDATLIAVKYEKDKYRSGPTEADAIELAKLAKAMIAGDPNLQGEHLALGVVRAETLGKSNDAVATRAREILERPAKLRARAGAPLMDEIVLARAALAADDPVPMIERLDEIESAAAKASAHAHPREVAHLGWVLERAKKYSLAFECQSRLALRPEPAYYEVLGALRTLLKGTEGPIVLEGRVKKTVDACTKRVTQMGKDAQDAIYYDLACVSARAGQRGLALKQLKACKNIRKINARPEEDTDFVTLWEDDAFLALLGGVPKKKGEVPDVSIDDLELSVSAMELLQDLEVKDLAGVVALKPSDLTTRIVTELRTLLKEEYAIEWGAAAAPKKKKKKKKKNEWKAPPGREVPRIAIELEEGGDPRALTNRIGGLPLAPSPDTAWPESDSRPMQLVAQLVGKAAGGELDLGDIHVVQIFADMEGDYYEENAVVIHRETCAHVLELPIGLEELETKTMQLEPGFDDALLLEDDAFDHEDHDGASSHAFCDKLFGVPVGANLDVENIRDSKDVQMKLLLELITYDDWFLWALFTNADFSEMKLEVVRG
jgi:hypothetical protein